MRDINSIVVINVALVNTEDTFLLNVLELAEELLRFKSEQDGKIENFNATPTMDWINRMEIIYLGYGYNRRGLLELNVRMGKDIQNTNRKRGGIR